MGFDEGDLLFDSPSGAYYSGQFVNGKLVFELNKVKKIRGIYVKVKGYCKVHWTTRHSRRVNDRREVYTVTHESHEEYINMKMYLIGSKNTEITLELGKHEFDFQFQLPEDAPSSFEGSKGHVRYEVKAVVDRPFAVDDEKVRLLRVYDPLDLNRANCNEPVHFEFDQSYCCWCMSAGSSETLVKLPVRGYCPGQIIPVEISCQNRSNVEIDAIKFAIKKEIIYHAETEPATEDENEVVLEVQKGPVAGNTDRNWLLEMKVPDLDVCNMQHCAFIDVRYQLKVTVSPSGCHSDDDDTVELVLGTIPLVGFQDDVPNPLQDQMPQSNIIPQTMMPQNHPTINAPYPPPIINQPVGNTPSPYPGYPGQISPYPGSPNPPYPAPNVPYPGPNAPFPGANPQPITSPYPNQSPYPNAPFPQNNGLNPPQGSPYMNQPLPNGHPLPFPSPNPPLLGSSANPPYPADALANSPYPVNPANPPYLGDITANPPYPTNSPANPPYPANSPANPPYPANSPANPPYPANSPANPPYPANSPVNPDYSQSLSAPKSPYSSRSPGLGGGSSLRTGNLGFVGTKQDAASVPLLPEGSVPYPIGSSPSNPYASASAPAPATPDDDKKPAGIAATNSPYNPEFMDEKKRDEEKPGNN